MSLDLYSREFEDGEEFPREYTCDGENLSPPLVVKGVPEEAVSLVLVMDDPDSPSGSFLHWMVWNLPAKDMEIPAGELPDGAVEGYNDFGQMQYGGPCPGSGQHTYQLKLFALDIELELDEDVKREKLEKEMAGHILDEVVFTGVYQRS